MASPRVVIIGGGVAGTEAALSSARAGAETVVVEAGAHVGISRSMLPFLLAGRAGPADIVLPQAALLGKEGIEVLTNQRVASVDVSSRLVKTGSRNLRFDSLVLCTGSSAQTPSVRGLAKEDVFVLCGPDDYIRLSASVDRLTEIVVSGPVPTALRVCELLSSARGIKVTGFFAEKMLEQFFPGEITQRVVEASAPFGVRLIGSRLEGILGVDRVEAVMAGDTIYPCECVVLLPTGVPAVPSVGCERGSHGGVLVDHSMRTSTPHIFAAGDCAEWKLGPGSVSSRLESSSRVCGQVAGVNAAGGSARALLSRSISQSCFGVEYCSSGLTEEEATALGMDVSKVEGSYAATGAVFRSERASYALVFERETHRLRGIQVAGWRAGLWANAAAVLVATGAAVEELVHMEFPFSPGMSASPSPIGLTAAKNAGPERGQLGKAANLGLRQS